MRRGVASVMTALVLVGGGASLTACSDPAGRGVVTGTPRDQSHNTAGNNPSDKQQGNLPNLSNRQPQQPVRGKHTGKGVP